MASPKPEYEFEGPINYVPPLSAFNVIPSVQEPLIRVLARLERAFSTPIILDAPSSTVPDGLSTTLVDPSIVLIGPSSALADPPMASVILPQTSRPSTGS